MKKWIIISCSLLLLAGVAAGVCALLWHSNIFTLQLTLAGPEELTLEYGESYSDPGAEAFFQGNIFCKDGLQVPVQVSGQADPSRVGTYSIQYTATVYTNYFMIHQEHTVTKNRTIHVVDTQAPVITLFSQDGYYTLPNHPYEEEGFSASDEYDGDLTPYVQRVEQDGTVTYTVSDSSGNTTVSQRPIYYYDPLPPTLTLLGDDIVLHPQGEEYVDPGYIVEDNCDDGLVPVITGGPDIHTPGIYELTYTVTDTYGHQVTANRRVVVRASTVWPEDKTIYLTFDDGPGPYTAKLLDVLKKYDVKATFFVVNTSRLYLVERMVQEGHKVALHSNTHLYAEVYASEEAYFADLTALQDAISQYTDQPLTLIRFPGGGSNTVSRRHCPGIMTLLSQRIAEEGYYYFDWNVDSNDAGGSTTSEEVYQNVINGIANRKVSMVLMHDIKGYSVEAVEDIIIWALDHGYTFKTIDESTPGFHYKINN